MVIIIKTKNEYKSQQFNFIFTVDGVGRHWSSLYLDFEIETAAGDDVLPDAAAAAPVEQEAEVATFDAVVLIVDWPEPEQARLVDDHNWDSKLDSELDVRVSSHWRLLL